MTHLKKVMSLGAAASLLLLSACGGEAEEPEMAAMDVPADETVTDEVTLPNTMPAPGDFTDPAGEDDPAATTPADATATPTTAE